MTTRTGVHLPPFHCEIVILDLSLLEAHPVSARRDIKKIDKLHIRNHLFREQRTELQNARREFKNRERRYVAIDFEQWEKSHSKILGWHDKRWYETLLTICTEFGIFQIEITSDNRDAQGWQIRTDHILIKE